MIGVNAMEKATATVKGPGPTMRYSGNVNWDAFALIVAIVGQGEIDDSGLWQNTSKVKQAGNNKYKFFAQ